MTITVETGAIVANANSYVSLDDARAYASGRGVTLSAVDATLETVVIKAMDYLESFSNRFKGDRVQRDQPLSWPRTGVTIENWSWSHTEIPRQVINAQLALILEINAGEDPLNPPAAALPQVRKKVGPIEVEYANPTTVSKVTKTAASSALINLLLRNSGLFAVRV